MAVEIVSQHCQRPLNHARAAIPYAVPPVENGSLFANCFDLGTQRAAHVWVMLNAHGGDTLEPRRPELVLPKALYGAQRDPDVEQGTSAVEMAVELMSH